MFVVSLSRNLSRPDPRSRIVTLDGVPSRLSSVQLAVRRQGEPGIYLAPGGWQADAHWYTPPQAWWDGHRLKVVVGAELSGQLGTEMIALSLRGGDLEAPAETAFFWDEPDLQEHEPAAAPAAGAGTGAPILDLGRDGAGDPQPDEAPADDAALSTLPALAVIAGQASAPTAPPAGGELLIVRSGRLRQPSAAAAPPAATVPNAPAEAPAEAPRNAEPRRPSGNAWLVGAVLLAAAAFLGAVGFAYQSLKPMLRGTAPAAPEVARVEAPTPPLRPAAAEPPQPRSEPTTPRSEPTTPRSEPATPEPASPPSAPETARVSAAPVEQPPTAGAEPAKPAEPPDRPVEAEPAAIATAPSPETSLPETPLPEADRPETPPPEAALSEQPEAAPPPAAAPETASAEPPAEEPAPPPPLVSEEAQGLLQQGRDALLGGRPAEADRLLRQAAELDRTGSVAMVIAKSLFDPVLQSRFGSAATVDALKAQDYYRIAAGRGKAAEAALRLADLKFWARLQRDDPAALAVLQHSP